MLLAAAIEEDEDVARAAKTVMADLPDPRVDADLLDRLPNAEGKTALVLIEMAGQRGIEAALPALMRAANDTDDQIRQAALGALGSTVGMRDLLVLIHRVVSPLWPQDAKAAEEALMAACTRMPDREACAEQLVAPMGQAAAAAKCSLLKVFGAIGGAKALQEAAAAARDANPEVQDTASRLLGQWMSADAAPVLLDLAKTPADEKYKTRACEATSASPGNSTFRPSSASPCAGRQRSCASATTRRSS